MRKMYNYFVVTTTAGDAKPLSCAVLRAPLGHTWMSTKAEKFCGGRSWKPSVTVDTHGGLHGTPGGKKFPGNGRAANAFMRKVARRERAA